MPAPQFLQHRAVRLSEAAANIQPPAANQTGKLHSIAQRIAATKKSLDNQADQLAARLDDLDKKAPDAFKSANALIDQHNTDIDAMEAELRQLSNL
jgi:hypothetical protein